MQSNTALQVVIVLVVAAIGAYAVIEVAHGWGDWVVLGVIILGVYGASLALHQRRFTTKKRSFVRHWDEPS
jgi:hypothetical protein